MLLWGTSRDCQSIAAKSKRYSKSVYAQITWHTCHHMYVHHTKTQHSCSFQTQNRLYRVANLKVNRLCNQDFELLWSLNKINTSNPYPTLRTPWRLSSCSKNTIIMMLPGIVRQSDRYTSIQQWVTHLV